MSVHHVHEVLLEGGHMTSDTLAAELKMVVVSFMWMLTVILLFSGRAAGTLKC